MAFLRSVAFFCVLLSPLALPAQKLLAPDDFLPHKLGEQFTPHFQMVEYFRHAAANSSRIILKQYGKTYEDRPLIYAVVSSKENLANLEQIRLNNLRRAGMVAGKPDDSNPIAIVWLSLNVHGNEAASSETSMLLLYNLLDSTRADVQEWLKNTVVVIDPCVNPDGNNRYTHWYIDASDKIPNPNPEAREHREPWPGGRSNHYLFDLNRDWAWATQTESQQRLEIYHQWFPHVHVDYHEMGYREPYYFAPAAEPFHKLITPFQRSFQTEIGKNHATYFDQNGWLYFTRETYDLFYPSYGDTYPTYNGAIGMTYEQGGIRAGRVISLDNGLYLTLKDRIQHHLTTALSTIEISSKNADRLVQNFTAYFKEGSENPKGTYKSFIIRNTNSRDKIKALTILLDRHKIQYGRAGQTASLGAYDYTTGKDTTIRLNENDLVINTRQPRSTLAQVLFNPDNELADSATYDITAWSIPLAYGLQAYASKQSVGAGQPFMRDTFVNRIDFSSAPTYAYIIPWKGLNAARFLSHVMQRGVNARVATAPFVSNKISYPSGTVIVARADNTHLGERFGRELIANSTIFEQEVIPMATGFAETGPDVGSAKMELLKKPSVAILYDDHVDVHSYGQVWYYFEQELHYPVTSIATGDVGRARLSQYNIIILPEGGYADMDSGKLAKLTQWVADGGRLIAIGEALGALEDKKGFELSRFASKKEEEAQKEQQSADKLARRFAHYEDIERTAVGEGNPGSIVRVQMDNTHPLAYGMPNYYYSLKTGTAVYPPLKNAWNVGYTDGKLNRSGFMGHKLEAGIKNSAVFAVQNSGRGAIIYMVDNPLFRGFWYQGLFLFGNAVFMPMN